jgi:aryl-alcohol dehydrogenase-like predicted oxidoreductase
MRGWSPLIALQLEYSLLERTIEGELIPAAEELGVGITPWSPLKAGMLTGKYTRENRDTAKPNRAAMVERAFTDEAFRVVDVLVKVAKELDTTPARVALAWVQEQSGVASTIIGARTVQQLDDNVGALEVGLSKEHSSALDDVSRPKLNFPYDFIRGSPAFSFGGTTVNGITAPAIPTFPKNDAERY